MQKETILKQKEIILMLKVKKQYHQDLTHTLKDIQQYLKETGHMQKETLLKQ